MAKIETLDFIIDGVTYSSNINVNTKGIFSIKLNWEVSTALGLETNSFEESKLDDIKRPLLTKYKEYKEALKKYYAYIGIVFKSSGYYSNVSWKTEHKISGFEKNVISFYYKLYIKEIWNDKEVWNEARRVEDTPKSWIKEDSVIVDSLLKERVCYRTEGILIPYSDEAFRQLEKGKENLKRLAEMFYTFVTQDASQIESVLKSGLTLGSE